MAENEVMETMETTTEVADVSATEEKTDNGIKLDAKTAIAGVAAAGLVFGAGTEIGKRAVDGVCQVGYNLFRSAQDKLADLAEAKEQKKAEREAEYQRKKAEKEAKKAEKENK